MTTWVTLIFFPHLLLNRELLLLLLLHLLNGLFSTTTWVSWHQKGKPFWILLAQLRDDGMAMASAGPHANHLHLAPDR